MKHLWKAALAACVVATVVAPSVANAQLAVARVVANCGTVSPAPHAGTNYPITIDITGTLCTVGGGGGGGGTSSNFGTAFPGAGTAAGAEYLTVAPTLSNGNMVALQTDINGNLKVNIASGTVSFTWPGTAGNATGGTTAGAGIMPYVNAYPAGPLIAGSAIIGKAGIDQTTPGTTNGVSLAQIGATTVASGTGAVGAGSQRVAVGTDTATIAGSAPSTVLQTNNTQWGGTAITNVPTAVGTAGTGNTPTVNAYIVGGGGSGGVSATDGSAFTYGSTSMNTGGCVYNSSISNLTSGQAGGVACTNNRNQLVDVLTSSTLYGALTSGVQTPGSTPATTNVAIGGTDGSAARTMGVDANNNVKTANAINVTATDCSGTIATGGTAQPAITAAATIHGFTIANTDPSTGSGEPLWISFTTTATAATAGSYPLPAPSATTFAGMGSYTTPPGFGSNHAVSIVGATSAHKYSCTFW